jgi:hypothetical protein
LTQGPGGRIAKEVRRREGWIETVGNARMTGAWEPSRLALKVVVSRIAGWSWRMRSRHEKALDCHRELIQITGVDVPQQVHFTPQINKNQLMEGVINNEHLLF